MSQWYMLTLVGQDRPGIVSQLTQVLYEAGCNLGEASMIRLAGNFTTMLMVHSALPQRDLESLLKPLADRLDVRLHVDAIAGSLHDHPASDVRITVYGADRAGIVARVTSALAEAGFNILDLESTVGGNEQSPIYMMYIEGQAAQGLDELRDAVRPLADEDIDITIEAVDIMVG